MPALARSKLMNEPSSSSSETPESLPSNEPLPPALRSRSRLTPTTWR